MKNTIFALALAALLVAGASAQSMKAYKNGTTEFVPPGTSFDLTATDQLIGVAKTSYSINNGEVVEYTDPIVFNDEGRFTLTYWSEDLLGNIGEPQMFTFTVDATPPILTTATRGVSFVLDGVLYLKSTTGILLAPYDSGAGVESLSFSLDNENYIAFNEEAFVSEEGPRSAWAYATDRVGNKSEPLETKLVVDNTAPTIAIVPLDPFQAVRGDRYAKPGNSYIVRATDDVAGVKFTEVSVNRQEFFTYNEPLMLSEPGAYSIRARSTDNLGNTSALPWAKRSFRVLPRPPLHDSRRPRSSTTLQLPRPPIRTGLCLASGGRGRGPARRKDGHRRRQPLRAGPARSHQAVGRLQMGGAPQVRRHPVRRRWDRGDALAGSRPDPTRRLSRGKGLRPPPHGCLDHV